MEKQTYSQSLIGFRNQIGVLIKNSDNPFFKSKYVQLPDILSEIKKPLSDNNLSIVHCNEYQEDKLVVVSKLYHFDELKETSVFPVLGSKPQEIGSSMTYARRYNISSLLDLPADEDDDGNKVSNGEPIKNKTKKASVWFDPKNENHIKSLQDNRNKGVSNEDIVRKIRDSGMGISKVNAELIMNNKI